MLSEVFAFFLQESGYTRMILKSDGKPSITALVTAVQKEWAGDCKDFLRQLIPRTSPVDVYASKGAVEGMMHSLETHQIEQRGPWKRFWESRSCLPLRSCRGWQDI